MSENVYQYAYPRPALTVDAAVFRYHSGGLQLLLIQRKDEPYKNYWAMPGGFVNEGEIVEEAMDRELEEETGLRVKDLQQVFCASKPGRDPRGWTVSIIFLGFLPGSHSGAKAGDDAAEAEWYALDCLPELAFDHQDIIDRVRQELKKELVLDQLFKICLPKVITKGELYTLLKLVYVSGNEIDAIFHQLSTREKIRVDGETIRFA